MPRFQGPLARLLVWFCVLATGTSATAQTTTQTPPPKPQDEVVRTYTELVQTDVMVMNKQGQFVDGLTKEDFELRIDGKPRPIEFFEKITAGSDEEAQLAAARGATTINVKRPVPLDRGRIVFFYLDDLHMDHAGVVAARKTISTYIDKHLGQNDQAALTSASGQIGFLQQLTGDRKVLRMALDRVTSRRYSSTDHDRPPMREYEAMLIERNDRQMVELFISETMRQNPGIQRSIAEQIVRNRAQVTMTQASHANINTLSGLESLIRSARNLPGRKVLFFLSGGFLLESRRGSTMSKLREIINAAAKSGVVIYSMDTRGLVATLRDASMEEPFDPRGQFQASSSGELVASQDGMNALAVDTGGKAIFNANDLSKGLAPAIKETSTYYLLAWKPDPASQKQGRFRQLEVKLVSRSDLTVRVRKGFFDVDPPSTTASTKKPEQSASIKTPTVKLREAIAAPYPQRALPILMSVDYYDIAEKGPMLSTAIQLPGEFLSFGAQPDGKIQAVIDLSGVFYDDKGTMKANFMERIVSTAPSLEAAQTNQADITFNYPTQLPPGLYQVRVAVRDDKSGNIGTAHSWIEIPDLAKKQLIMSSLLLGERPQTRVENASNSDDLSPVALSASHRFSRESMLRFLLFAYNTARSPADQKPDVAVQVQVIRDDQPVITTALRKITTDGVTDLARIPYAAEIPLNELLPGRYHLRVSLIDRVAKQSTSRETHFDVY